MPSTQHMLWLPPLWRAQPLPRRPLAVLESSGLGTGRAPQQPLTFHEDLQIDLAVAAVAVGRVHDVAVVGALILQLHFPQGD